jgi:hypothetical protein
VEIDDLVGERREIAKNIGGVTDGVLGVCDGLNKKKKIKNKNYFLKKIILSNFYFIFL